MRPEIQVIVEVVTYKSNNGIFQKKKNLTPLLKIIIKKSREGGQSKSRWNSRGMNQKLRKKHGFPGGGVNAKKWKIPGGHGKFDWKSRGLFFL